MPWVGSKKKELPTLYYYAPKLNSYHDLVVPFSGARSFELNHPFTMWNYDHREFNYIYRSELNYAFFMNHPNFDSYIKTNKRLTVYANDLDDAINDISYVMLFEPKRLMASLQSHLKSQSFFNFLKNHEFSDYWYRALRKLYMVCLSYGSLEKNWIYVINNKRNRRINISKADLLEIRKRLTQIFLFGEDYRVFLDRFITKLNSPAFFYLDPPYVIAARKSYYEKSFDDWNDHLEVKKKVDEIDASKHYFMLSYDANDKIEHLYRDYNIIHTDMHYRLQKQNPHDHKPELLITNYTNYAKDEYMNVLEKRMSLENPVLENPKRNKSLL